MSLTTALSVSGISLFFNQQAQFIDLEDDREFNQSEKSGMCLSQSATIGIMGGGVTSFFAYACARSISSFSPTWAGSSTAMFCVVGGVIGLTGIDSKIQNIKYIWDKHSMGLSTQEKIKRAAIDTGIFIATSAITTLGCLAAEEAVNQLAEINAWSFTNSIG